MHTFVKLTSETIRLALVFTGLLLVLIAMSELFGHDFDHPPHVQASSTLLASFGCLKVADIIDAVGEWATKPSPDLLEDKADD